MNKSTILIVSGFLGAGKTTFIRQLIKELDGVFPLMVLENDFGQENFDGALLQQDGIYVRELTSGCICCSLVEDFQTTLKDILKNSKEQFIIIEPSGVAKLSDIINTCMMPEIKEKCHYLGAITIVDAMKAPLYAANFGEFFRDQIEYAQTVLLSHSDEITGQTEKSIKLIQEINSNISIHEENWQDLNLAEDLHIMDAVNKETNLDEIITPEHHHHEHSLPVFSAVTLRPVFNFTEDDIIRRLEQTKEQFQLLRLKGHLPTEDGEYYEVQFTPSTTEIKIVTGPYKLCITIIGTKLRGGALKRIWEEQ